MAIGSVQKRSGSWYAVYRVCGRQKWERASSSKKDAERLLSARMNDVHSGEYRERPRIRFSDFAAKWLTDYARVSVKESTYSSYADMIRLHLIPHFGSEMLHQVTAGDVQRFISQKISRDGLSAKSVVNIIVVLKEMLKHAQIWGYLSHSPATHAQRPRVEEKEMEFLTPDEIRLFLQNVSPCCYCLFLTAVLTGMRRGELLGLKWSDIDWQRSEIVVRRSLYKNGFVTTKSKRSNRRIQMSPVLADALKRHRAFALQSEQELVFCNRDGQPLDPDNMVKREFHPALDRAGLRRIRFHDLRHTHASLLIAQGENVKFVQQQLGHASAKTTLDRYGHLMPSMTSEAGRRLDQTVFGELSNKAVRKLLENPVSEGNSPKSTTPEVIELQGLKIGSGAGI